MIFAIVPIVLLFEIIKVYRIQSKAPIEDSLFRSLCISICIWAILLFAMTEILSVIKVLEARILFWTWLIVDLLLFVYLIYMLIHTHTDISMLFCEEKKAILAFNRLEKYKKYLVLFLLFTLIGVLALSIVTVPYNWDSMTYHLPRIMFWKQNHTVEHYATNDIRQLSSPVLSEFINLHSFILYGSDQFFNAVQAFSFVFDAIGVYAISKLLGLNLIWRLVSMFLAISMPIAFGEALTTQVDLLSSVWAVIFVFLCLRLQDKEQLQYKGEVLTDIVFLGISLGLAYITKQSSCICMVIFAVGLFVCRLMKKETVLHLLPAVLIVALITVAIISPEISRNLVTFHAVSSKNVGAKQLIGTLKPNYLIVNFVKNLFYTLPTVFIFSSEILLYYTMIGFSRLMGVNLDDPAISEGGMAYQILPATNFDHDSATNSLIVLLLLIVIVTVIVLRITRKKKSFGYYEWCSLISYFIFLLILRWEPYETRYQIAFLMILCPMISFCLNKCTSGNQSVKVPIISVILFTCISSVLSLFSFHWILYKNRAHYRPSGYFANNSEVFDTWEDASSIINEKQYDSLGFHTTSMYYSYPVWAMCDSVSRIEYIVDKNSEAYRYEDSTFTPDAILWLGDGMPSDSYTWHGETYHNIHTDENFVILER